MGHFSFNNLWETGNKQTNKPKAAARAREVVELGISNLTETLRVGNGLCIVGTDQPKATLKKVQVKSRIDKDNEKLLKKHPPNQPKVNKELRKKKFNFRSRGMITKEEEAELARTHKNRWMRG